MVTSFLTLEQVLLIHDQQIELFGGSSKLRDLALLESAVMRPQTTFGGDELYDTIFKKAAALIHSIVLNHPFVDGNKRTGMVSGVVFLELNGYMLNISNKDLVSTALKIATKEIGIEGISEWLRVNARTI